MESSHVLRSVWQACARASRGFVAWFFYRVRASGREHLPRRGGVLLLSNHLSHVDAIVLQIAARRPVHFFTAEPWPEHLFLRVMLRLGRVEGLPSQAPAAQRSVVAALRRGEAVCLFPEGNISRTGQLLRIRSDFEPIAREAGVPVVPVAHDGLWGSVFSFSGNKYVFKSPRLKATPVMVCFGAPLDPLQANAASVRRALLDLGSEAFARRPVLERHLAREVVRALAKQPRRVAVIDRTAERRVVSAGRLLAVSAALAQRIKERCPERRVGIVLPPGAGAMIANVAVLCSGRIPVNLNFTVGRSSVEACLRAGEIKTVITADAMRAKLPDFPWPERTLDLRGEIEAVGKPKIVAWLLAIGLLPNQWTAALMRLPHRGGDEEAALLFTSGSSGEPKGVPYSHRNILANCWQISSTTVLPSTATLLGCLPVFHAFGFTITVWYVIIRGLKLVTVPSPLDTKRMVDAIRGDAITVVIGAPTFLRPLLKRAERADLRSLELLVSGAEKMPLDLYQAFRNDLHVPIMQGYGLTETTPVISVNQHDAPPAGEFSMPQAGNRLGSVGRMLPGLTARIVDPDTLEERASTEIGLVLYRGANVFNGYLNDPAKTRAAFRDGWFVSGDLGRFDEDGFLYIEGRLSRFSKIGGEMVPHGTIEQTLVAAFSWDQLEHPAAVVVGVPDPAKGEALVLLTTQEVTPEKVRDELAAAGMPNLWVPKIVARVEQIPLLGTGKLDLKSCREIAEQLAKKR